jgi:hypothetical protein
LKYSFVIMKYCRTHRLLTTSSETTKHGCPACTLQLLHVRRLCSRRCGMDVEGCSTLKLCSQQYQVWLCLCHNRTLQTVVSTSSDAIPASASFDLWRSRTAHCGGRIAVTVLSNGPSSWALRPRSRRLRICDLVSDSGYRPIFISRSSSAS